MSHIKICYAEIVFTTMSIRKKLHKSQGTDRKIILVAVALLVLLNAFLIKSVFFSTSLTPSESEALAKSFAKSCESEVGWRDCYGFKFKLLAREQHLESTLQVLDRLQYIDEKTRDCHIMAHRIMSEYVKRAPGDWEKYLNVIDPNNCTYGFIHGIIEARGVVDGSFVLDEKTVPSFCQMLVDRKKGQGIDQTCAHIMGHLLLAQQYGSIPEAVAICRKIPDQLQRECFGGLFMENYTRDNLVIHGIATYAPWDEKLISTQETMCNTYTGNAGLGCWEQMSNLYSDFYDSDPNLVYVRCQKASKKEFTDMCYIQSMIMFMQASDPPKAYYQHLCDRYVNEPGNYEMCTHYAVGSVINASLKLVDRAFNYCDALGAKQKPLCYPILGIKLNNRFSYAEQLKLCSRLLQQDFKKSCMYRT